MKKALITVTIVIFVILSVFSVFFFDVPISVIRPVFHKQIINYYAQQYKLDPLFVTAIIKAESKFLHKARSHRGAIGLMQLMPSTAEELAKELGFKEFSEKKLEEPNTNINLGMYYLSKLEKYYSGDQIKVLAAYNAGMGNVESWHTKKSTKQLTLEDIPFKETKAYVSNVLRTYQWLKETQKIKKLIRGKII